MKKAILLLSSALLLVGCGSTEGQKNDPERESEQKQPEDNPPEDNPPKDDKKYFLPSRFEEYDGLEDEYTKETTFEYDEDLLGYKKTIISDYGDKEKTVETYKFSDDFSKLTYTEYTYNFIENKFVFYEKEKFEYRFSDNGSYEVFYYDSSEENGEFELINIKGRVYNKFGELTRLYTKEPKEGGGYYYSDYITYSFDENGYPLENMYYDYSDEEKTVQYVQYRDEYVYENNGRSKAVMNSYSFDEETQDFAKTGYTDIIITKEGELLKFDEQIYYSDGSVGNHNVFKYTKDFRAVYTNYGGMKEESALAFNDSGLLSKYTRKDESSETEANFTYEGNGISNCVLSVDYGSGSYVNTSTFTYNDNKQLQEAKTNVAYKDGTDEGNYERKITITYSSIQNKDLLENMDYMEDIYQSYAHYSLNYGGSLI